MQLSEKEAWKPITGYEGLYEVSNYGKVRSLDRFVPDNKNGKHLKGQLIKAFLGNIGYYGVGLFKNSSGRRFLVHRLVGVHFIENPRNLPFINHIDCDQLNNHYSNLEWCTNKENIHHALLNGLMPIGERHYRTRITDADLGFIRRLHEEGKTQKEIAVQFSVDPSCISRYINRKRGGAYR